MQKKSNFVKMNKTIGVICAAVVLLTSILAADLLVSPNNRYVKVHENGGASMYRQLEYYVADEISVPENTAEMNNFEFENSNTAFTSLKNSLVSEGFDGIVSVLDANNGKVVNMAVDDYVLCVLVAEMPLSFDMQALMAQAVAVRSYTLRNALYGSKHKNADVCSDYRCCQAMIFPSDINFDVSKAKEAVKNTSGIIAVSDGIPILAAYHSSSYGTTKSSEEVWGGKVSYLVPVFAPEDKSVSAHTVKIDKKKVQSVFLKNGLKDDFVFECDTDGICVCASDGVKNVFADEIRRLLGLRSDTFTVSDDGECYTFTSYGFGHGVGMSQYGADALAKSGYSFYEILKHYYTGISFGFLD